MRLRFVVALATITLLGVVIVVPVGLMYHRLHPDRVAVDDDPGRHGIAYQAVSFASPLDGASLKGWYMASSRPTGRAIVIVPGIDNNRLVSGIALGLAPGLLASGFDVLTFDLRGEGESGGDPITFGAHEHWDVLGAVQVVQAHGDRQVAVLGFSLGAASAILAAARSPDIVAVVADSSFADLTDTLTRELEGSDHLPGPVAAYALALYRLMSGTDPGDVAPERLVAAIAPRPVLLIQGTADQTVPASDSDRLLAAAATATTERWLVAGGRHAESYFVDPQAYLSRVASFFSASMPEGE
jgi:fermentation-respiration switch protein FrsA (DUF1100 family)